MITTYGFGDSSWLLGSTIYSFGAIKLRLPFVSLAQALTILIQGYVSVRIGIMEARSQRELGIAGVIAAVW